MFQRCLGVVLLVLALAADQAVAAPRRVTSLDFDWRFHRGDLPDFSLTNDVLSPPSQVLGRGHD
ncbi:MAG TPA: hypothetical protein VG167_02180 [Verrucomicrobiae bacterium]|nr:hypothetical protein [Verrucomicrobiae bacterium]